MLHCQLILPSSINELTQTWRDNRGFIMLSLNLVVNIIIAIGVIIGPIIAHRYSRYLELRDKHFRRLYEEARLIKYMEAKRTGLRTNLNWTQGEISSKSFIQMKEHYEFLNTIEDLQNRIDDHNKKAEELKENIEKDVVRAVRRKIGLPVETYDDVKEDEAYITEPIIHDAFYSIIFYHMSDQEGGELFRALSANDKKYNENKNDLWVGSICFVKHSKKEEAEKAYDKFIDIISDISRVWSEKIQQLSREKKKIIRETENIKTQVNDEIIDYYERKRKLKGKCSYCPSLF